MTNLPYYTFLVYGIFLFLSLIFSFLINSLFLRFVRTLGIRNQDETIIRWGSQSKPAVGGFSFYFLFLLSIILYSVFFDNNQVFLNKQFIGILLATMLGFLLGMADDSYNTKPLLKLFTQIGCGLILLFTGTKISISTLEPFNYFITVFWVVGIMNSINMLDNMDAISSTVSISIILSALTVMIFSNELSSVYFMISLGVMGALIGFLYFNWHPSKMYMGDTGSQFIGVFLAAMGIICFWNSGSYELNISTAKNLLLPLVVFIMPIVDTTIVTVNRLSKGKSPFVGGKDHTTHALAYLGLSDRQVALVFWCVSLVSLLIVFIIQKYLSEWRHIYTILFSLYFLTILGLFFYASRSVKSVK